MKRFYSLLIALVTVAAIVLSACSNNNGSSNTGTGSPAASGGTGANATETAGGGNAITFPYTGDPVELTLTMPDFRTADKTFDKLIDQELAKLFGNIKINYNYVSEGDLGQKAQLMLDTGEMSDIVFFGMQAQQIVNKWGASGNLLDFTPYLDAMPNYQRQAERFPDTSFGKQGNSIFAIAPLNWNPVYGFNMNINKYYVNKHGIKTPTTSDELLQALRAAKQANPAATSLYTVFPGGRSLVMLNQMFLGLPDSSVTEQGCQVAINWKTKEWYYPCFDPALKDEIAFAHTMYTEGLMAKDYDTQSWDKFVQGLNDPSGAQWLFLGDYAMFDDDIIATVRKTNPDFDVDFIMMPTTPNIDKPVVWLNSPPGVQNWSIVANANTKHPEIVAAFIDFLQSEQVDTLLNWGIEGKTFQRVPADEFGIDKAFLPEIKTRSNPAGTVEADKEFGLYWTDAYRKQLSYMAGGYSATTWYHISQIVGQSMLGDYKIFFDYGKEHPEQIVTTPITPEVTADEGETIAEIYAALNTVVAKNINDFIKGKRPMDQWDQFVAELKKAGDPQKIIDIYNSKPKIEIAINQ